jgi:GntR family transcriptional regulator
MILLKKMTIETMIKLDFRKKIPISDQVQKEMRRLIQAGLLQPGDQLPTVRVLAAQLKVNFNTIARAYRMLDQEGLISTQQGRGTYVMEIAATDEKRGLTKEERADQLVSALIENASEQGITIDELNQAFQRSLQKTDNKKQPARKRKIHTCSKKRISTPAHERAWVKTKSGLGLKRHRKAQKHEPIRHRFT